MRINYLLVDYENGPVKSLALFKAAQCLQEKVSYLLSAA